MHDVTIIYVSTFHRNKGDFHVSFAVMSFEERNHYIVVNFIDVVYSAEYCCASNMKL